ncbi:CASP-like protein 2C1 [Argentina anserina]|uniref:CASP-like protein 2C1 n=1 Tax=Argentina anserina TaxID=57926 RepID=UPI00217623D0|nr:CASP-like protein 2C1 [Potentilla anserina]
MKFHMEKTEAFLRLSSVFLLVLTAILVGVDHQTKFVFFIRRKASFDDVNALLVLVYVDAVVAGYNLLRLFGECSMSAGFIKESRKESNVKMAWISLLLDQVAVYVAFGANSAAFQASLLAITGVPDFQWMKLCDKYTRFCFQIGGALSCGYLACLLMIFISFISAFNLFRLYSPNKLFLLKSISG